MEDRKAFNQELIQNIQKEFFKDQDLKDRILKLLVKRMISFFFLFIIEQGPTFSKDKDCCEFVNDIMLETLLTNARQVKIKPTEKEMKQTNKIYLGKTEKNEVKEQLEKEKEYIRPWTTGV